MHLTRHKLHNFGCMDKVQFYVKITQRGWPLQIEPSWSSHSFSSLWKTEAALEGRWRDHPEWKGKLKRLDNKKVSLWTPVQLQTTLDWQHIEAAGSRNFQHTPGWPGHYRSVSTLVIEILPQDFPGFSTGTRAALRRPASAVGDSSCPPCSGWSGSCRLALWSLQWRAWTRPRCPACGHRRPRWSWGKSHCTMNVTRKEFEIFSPVSFFCEPLENPCEVITSVHGLLLPSKDSCQCFLGQLIQIGKPGKMYKNWFLFAL